MALTDKDRERPGASPLVQLALLAGMTLLAAGIGWLTGNHLEDSLPGETAQTEASDAGARSGEEEATKPRPAPNILAITPITTNLAEPSEVWVRAEISLIFDGSPDPVIAEAIHQDFFAYFRTLRLRQVETPSGFLHLRDDLQERARLRSEGAVTGILVRTLLFE